MIKKWVVVFIKVADSRLVVTFFCIYILDKLKFRKICLCFFDFTLFMQVAFLLQNKVYFTS